MEQLLTQLRQMGFSPRECEAIRTLYEKDGDLDALQEYVLLMRLHYDDRHEYLD